MKTGLDIAERWQASGTIPMLGPSACASAAAHLAIAVVLACNLWGATESGGGGTALDAISVEVVDGRALDARIEAAAKPADASSTASVADRDGMATPLEAADETAPVDTSQPKAEPEKRVAEVRARSETEVLETGTLAVPPAPVAEAPKEVASESKEHAKPETTPTPATPASPAVGGVTARAEATGSIVTPAQPAASPGEANRYGGAVSRALNTMMRKLASSGHRGQVRILFVVGEKGEVLDVQVKESSGDGRLDTMAARLLRDASFPEPPARMSEAQRTFLVPIRVR